MKKLLSVLIALILFVTAFTTVFAADTLDNGKGIQAISSDYQTESTATNAEDTPQLPYTKINLKVGESKYLKVINGKAKSWSSSDEKVASVRKGKITALNKGMSTITVVLTTEKKLYCKVNVISASAKAKEYKSNHCVYTLDKNGNAAVIDVYDGDKLPKNYLKIPSELNGHKVTKINWEGYSLPSMIKIPKTVTSISKSVYKLAFDETDWNQDSRIVCYKDSYAYKYAHKYKINYIISGDNKTCGDLWALILQYGYKVYNSKGQVAKESRLLTNKVFTGGERKSTFTIKKGKYTLKKGRDYTVKYINNYAVGTASVFIKGKGKYWGRIDLTYDILPPQAKLNNVTKTSDDSVKIDLEWQDMHTQIVQYSTDKTFKTKKSHKIDSGNISSYTINNIEKGKKYYFRVRNHVVTMAVYPDIKNSDTGKYDIYMSGPVDYYGKWSEVKSITL